MSTKKVIAINLICITVYNILYSILGIVLPIIIIWILMAFLVNYVHRKYYNPGFPLFFDNISIFRGSVLGPLLVIVLLMVEWDTIKSQLNRISIRNPFVFKK